MSDKSNYVLITDSTCDLPENILKESGTVCLQLTYEIDGVSYEGTSKLSYEQFYEKMREGKMSSTSQITPDTFEKSFSKYLSEGKDVLYIAFSSGLSGTFNSSHAAMEELKDKFPDRKIRVIDSLCASLGEGLLVYKAICLKEQGKSFDEVGDWVEENKLHLCHMFTVDDLMFLHRGGRVSKTSAIAGSILGIKPGLHVDNEGHLIPLAKVRGRRQSINWLVSEMDKRIGKWENDTFAICHGDCYDDAMYLKKLVMDKYNIKNCIVRHTGPVIGAHSGPGTLALFFLGDYR